MADTTVYIITRTDADDPDDFAIQPRTFDGPGGVQQRSDLTLYGNAAPSWGERFNENFYHLLENFACPQIAPNTPKYISSPIIGQLWFNKTDNQLYTYDGSAWNLVGGSLDISDITGLQAQLDGKVNRAGDSNLSGVHSWQSLFLNEGNGNVSNGADIRMAQSGLISVDDSFYVHLDGDSSGTGAFTVSKGSLIRDGSETDLFRIEIDGTLHSEINNYETLVTHDDDIPNKKYVDDEIAAATGTGPTNFVEKTGDTMTDTLFFDLPNDTPGIHITSNTGPYVEIRAENTSSAPPSLVFYNADNDVVNRRPYTRLIPRDSSALVLEMDTITGSADGNVNQLDLFMVSQEGRFTYYGGTGKGGQIPMTSPEHVIRCQNATVSEVGSHTKNLATVEYVQSQSGFVLEEGSVLLPTGNVSGSVIFSNSYSIASATIGFDDGSGSPPNGESDSPNGFAGWVRGGSSEIIGFLYTFGSADGSGETLQWSVIGIPF